MEEDDDSDASDCLIIDDDRIDQTDPGGPTDANTRERNTSYNTDTKENISDQLHELPVKNMTTKINYAALMNEEHLKNIPFDILNSSNTTEDINNSFVNISKENRDTCNDISLILRDNIHKNKEDSVLYSFLIENNLSNLNKYFNSSVNNNSIPPNGFGAEEKKTSMLNTRLVDLLNKPAQKPELQSPRTVIQIPQSISTQGDGNITQKQPQPAEVTLSLNGNRRIASVIVPIGTPRAVTMSETSPSAHRQDINAFNCIPTSQAVMNGNSYQTPTVNGHQNQKLLTMSETSSSAYKQDINAFNCIPRSQAVINGNSYQTPTVNGHQNQKLITMSETSSSAHKQDINAFNCIPRSQTVMNGNSYQTPTVNGHQNQKLLTMSETSSSAHKQDINAFNCIPTSQAVMNGNSYQTPTVNGHQNQKLLTMSETSSSAHKQDINAFNCIPRSQAVMNGNSYQTPTVNGHQNQKLLTMSETSPSAHRQDINAFNCIPTSQAVMNRNSYQTPTVNGHQNQKLLNTDSRRHPNAAAPPVEPYSRQNVLMNGYSQANRQTGQYAPMYSYCSGPGCPINMAPPRAPLPNPHMPVMTSYMCPWPNCSKTRVPMNPAQTGVPGMPMSNPHTMMAWNGYGPAYNNNGFMPRDPRDMGPNMSAAQHLAAMSRNSYMHAISSQDRQHLMNINPDPSMKRKPTAKKARTQAPSKVVKNTKTKDQLSTKARLQSTKVNAAIKATLPNIQPPAYTMSNTPLHSTTPIGLHAPLRTDANSLPTGMSMNVETAETTMRNAGYGMNNIINGTHAPINWNPRTNMRTAVYNATYALSNTQVNLNARSSMQSAQVDATNNFQTHFRSETNIETTTTDVNIFGIRSAEFNMSKVTNSIQTFNTDNNMVLDMSMKRTKTDLRSANNTDDLPLAPLKAMQETNLSVAKINTETTETDSENDLQATLITEDHLESDKANVSIETSQADMCLDAIKIEIPSPAKTPADLPKIKIEIKIEPARENIRNIIERKDIDNKRNLQSTDTDSMKRSISDKYTVANNKIQSDLNKSFSDEAIVPDIKNITKDTETSLQKIETKTSIETQYGINTIPQGMSETADNKEVSLSVDAHTQQKAIDTSNNKTQSQLKKSFSDKAIVPDTKNITKDAKTSLQTIETKTSIETQSGINTIPQGMSETADNKEVSLSVDAHTQQKAIDTSSNKTQSQLKKSFSDKAIVPDTKNITKDTKTSLQKIETKMSIETQSGINTVPQGMSETANNKEVSLSVNAHTQQKAIDTSNNKTQSDVRTFSNNGIVADNINTTDTSLQNIETITSIEIAHVNTVPHSVSETANTKEVSLSINAHLQPKAIDTSYNKTQSDLKTSVSDKNKVADSMSNLCNSIKVSKDTETSLQKMEAQADIKIEIPSPSNKPGDLPPTKIEIKIEPTPENIPPDDDIGKNSTETLISDEDPVANDKTQSDLKQSFTDKGIVPDTKNITKDTETSLQKIETKTSIETQSGINTIPQGMSETANNKEVSLSINAHTQQKAIDTSNNKIQSDLKKSFTDKGIVADTINNTYNSIKVSNNTEISLQKMETKTSIQIAKADINTVPHGISKTANNKEGSLSVNAYLQQKAIDTSNNKTQSDLKISVSDNDIVADSNNTCNSIKVPKDTQTSLQKMETKTSIQIAKSDINTVLQGMSESANNKEVSVSVNAHSQPKVIDTNYNKAQSSSKLNASSNQIKTSTGIIQKKPTEGPIITKSAKVTTNTDKVHNPLTNKTELNKNSNKTGLHVNKNKAQVDIKTQINRLRATNDTNIERYQFPMNANARIEQATTNINKGTRLTTLRTSTESVQTHKINDSMTSVQALSSTCEFKVSTTSSTTEAITQNIVRNESTPLSNNLNVTVGSEIQGTNSTFNTTNQRVDTKVTVEIINRISEETDIDMLKAIIDNVQRNTVVQDRNTTPMITDAGNGANFAHNHEPMNVNNTENDEKLKAARKRLALITAGLKDSRNNCGVTKGTCDIKISTGPNGEYIPQIATLPNDGSFAAQTDHHNSTDSGQMHHKYQTKSCISLRTINLHNTEDNYSNNGYHDAQKALSVTKTNFKKNPEIDETVLNTLEESKKRYKKDEDNKEDSNGHLYSRRTADIQHAITIAIGQTTLPNTNEIQEEYVIDETLFFIFQIQFFRRVQERLKDNKRKKLAKKLEKNIRRLIAISDNDGAKADLKYKCHRCLQKVIYSPRNLYYKVDKHYLENINKTLQNCQICILFMTKYIEVLKKYVDNTNLDAESNRNNDRQIAESTNPTDEYQSRRLETQTNLSFNSINEYLCIDTEPESPSCNEESDTTNKLKLNYDSIEEQLSIISGVPITPAVMDDQGELNMVTVLGDNEKPHTETKIHNVVFKSSHIKLKQPTIESVINSKNIESVENQLATTGTTLNVTNDCNYTDTNEGGDHELRQCLSNEIEKNKDVESNISESDSNANNNSEQKQIVLLKNIIIKTAAPIISEQCNRNTNDNNYSEKKGEQGNGVATCAESSPCKRTIIPEASSGNAKEDNTKRHVVMKNNSTDANIGTNAELDSMNSSLSKENASKNYDGRHKINEMNSTKSVAKTNESIKAHNKDADLKNNESVHGVQNINSAKTTPTHITNMNSEANNDSFNSIKKYCDVRESNNAETARNSIKEPHNEKSISTNYDSHKEKKSKMRTNMNNNATSTTSIEPNNNIMNTVAENKNVDKNKTDESHKTQETNSNDNVVKTNECTTASNNDANQDDKRDRRIEKLISAKTAADRCNSKKKHRELRRSISTETARSTIIEPRIESKTIATNNDSDKDKKRDSIKRASIETTAISSVQPRNKDISIANCAISSGIDNRHTIKKTISADTVALKNVGMHKKSINTTIINNDAKQKEKESDQGVEKTISKKTTHSRYTNSNNEANNCIINNNKQEIHREKRKSKSTETCADTVAGLGNENINKTKNKEKKREKAKQTIEITAITNAEPHKENVTTASNNKVYYNDCDNLQETRNISARNGTSNSAEPKTAAITENINKTVKEIHSEQRKNITAKTAINPIGEQCSIKVNTATKVIAAAIKDRYISNKRHRELRKSMSTDTSRSAISEPRNESLNIETNKGNDKRKKPDKSKRMSIEITTNTDAEPDTRNMNTESKNNISKNQRETKKSASAETATSKSAEFTSAANNETYINKEKERQGVPRTRSSTETTTNTFAEQRNVNTSITTNEDTDKEKKREKRKRLSIQSFITTNEEPLPKAVNTAPRTNSGQANNINIATNKDNVKEVKREKRKRLSIESDIITNGEPKTSAVNTAPNNIRRHNNHINIETNENNVKEKKREKLKRLSIESDMTTTGEPQTGATNKNKIHEKKKIISIESASTTSVEIHSRGSNTKSRNNNNSESHRDVRKITSENTQARKNINTTTKNDSDNGKNKERNLGVEIISNKTATSKHIAGSTTAAKHDHIRTSNKRKHNEAKKSTSTEIDTNTTGDPRNENSENSDSKTDKKREKRHRISVESANSKNKEPHENMNTASIPNNNNENNSEKHHQIRKSSTDDGNENNENTEAHRKINKHATKNDKDSHKYNERDHILEKNHSVKTATSRYAAQNTAAKQDNINTNDKRREGKIRKSISDKTTSNTIKDSENKRIDVAKDADEKEKKREKRKRMSMESATTTIVESDNGNMYPASQNNNAKEHNSECHREKRKRVENANIENENSRINAKNDKDDRTNQEKVWTVIPVESNPSGIGKFLLKAQTKNKKKHELNNKSDTSCSTDQRKKNIVSASNNNHEGNIHKHKRKEKDCSIRRSISNDTITNTSANKSCKDKISRSNKKGNLDKNLDRDITKETPPIKSKTATNHVNTDINSGNTYTNPSDATVSEKHKGAGANNKNNEEQTNEDSDSSDTDSDTDEDSEADENETSGEEANQAFYEDLDDPTTFLKERCFSEELPAVKIPGKTNKKATKNKITKTSYRYQCLTCTCTFTYLESLFKHALNNHKLVNTGLMKYSIFRECAFCGRPIEDIGNKYNNHVQRKHPTIFNKPLSVDSENEFY